MTTPREVTASAPASASNLGPGFDLLGLSLAEPRDEVIARIGTHPGVTIKRVTGDDGRIPTDAALNTAGIAATETLRLAGVEDTAVELEVHKGMPIGSGLGSSAASAVAAAAAVNALIGSPLRPDELIAACIEAESHVSGRHADNVAPSLLGGLVLCLGVDPLDVIRLPIPSNLVIVVATPAFELETRRAREALPSSVPLGDAVFNSGRLAAFITACYTDDLELLSRAVNDRLHVPSRSPLIPGAQEVMSAARRAGALASSISGAGPSIFALCRGDDAAEGVAVAMHSAFEAAGLAATLTTGPAENPGVRIL